MAPNRESPHEQPRARSIKTIDSLFHGSTQLIFTRDHELIRRWAEERHAEPATGEATSSGPAAVLKVNDGGAGVRFNFPGVSVFRPIAWEEWFANFDLHHCAFVYHDDATGPLSSRYRIVRTDEWKDFLL